MPKRLAVSDHLNEDEMRARFQASTKIKERAHWQVVLLVREGRSTAEVARVVGYSPLWVRQLVKRYNQGGPQALGDGRGQAGGHNALLSQGVREELGQQVAGEVPPELGGGLWNSVKVARWLSARLGRPVSRQRGGEALRALGYSLQVPRPRHAKADGQEQEAFKKS